ncbi:hypothetical protein I79_019803 [Cricetulus griseus]|uniref:Uncharacterized protein n=1 Tax=Cricetulus griseus TaxID=10029 RepID=G3I8D9_CRIGR|nr:hypothetical protein I79_019803 [Cricetulus griseus]
MERVLDAKPDPDGHSLIPGTHMVVERTDSYPLPFDLHFLLGGTCSPQHTLTYGEGKFKLSYLGNLDGL